MTAVAIVAALIGLGVVLWQALLGNKPLPPAPPEKDFARWNTRPKIAPAQAAPVPRRAIAPLPNASGPQALVMEYADADGVLTEREIVAPRVFGIEDRLYIEAFCRLRGTRRTFRLDRVLRLRTHDGRESTQPASLLPRFGEVAPVPQAHARAMANVRRELAALVWIARTDRDIDAAEMEILVAFAEVRATLVRSRNEQRFDGDLLRLFIDEAAPTKPFAISGASSVKRAAAPLFRETAARLVASGGEPDRLKANRWQQLEAAMSADLR